MMPRMWRSALPALSCAALLLALAAGCSGERTRAVRVSDAEQEQDTKDYRAMLETARSRSAAEDTLGVLVKGLEKFRGERGRLPTNLFEMVRGGTLPAIPPPPAGAAYAYDPRNGNVRLVPVDATGRIAVPDDTFQPPRLISK